MLRSRWWIAVGLVAAIACRREPPRVTSQTAAPGTESRFENVATISHPTPKRDPGDGNNAASQTIEIMASVQDGNTAP